jgi:hypothetical protein
VTLGLGLGLPAGRRKLTGPLADLLSLSPTSLWLPFQQYLGEEEDGTGSVDPTDAAGFARNLGSVGSAGNLLEGVADRRPVWQAGGGLRWLEFDGTNDSLSAAPFATPQGFDILLAVRPTSVDGNERVLATLGTGGRAIFHTAAGQLSMFFGASLTGPVLADDTDIVVTARVNGVSSRIAVDNGAYTNGAAGSSSGTAAQIMGDGLGGFSAGRIYGYGVFPLLTDGQTALGRAAMGALQGRVL